MSALVIVGAGLANWIATTIVVESELTRPLREWLDRRANLGYRARRRSENAWDKARYLAACHLCAGMWVAFAETAVVGTAWPGFAGFVLTGLVVKAVGHLTLELVTLGRSARIRLEDE